ncbi:MAG: CpaF family protein, partial [Bacilli bacterium]|nr:CpaF family protein [Bacilli bacterium]
IDEITYGYDLTNGERSYLFNLIDGEVNGYGPITELLNDDNVTEIMVNSPCDVFIEIDGMIKRDDTISFINDEHIIRTIERLIEPMGKSIDINKPMVDARLSNGSRINAIIPPLSTNPIITIRKFRKNVDDMESLVGNGSLTPYMARFLSAAVRAKLNIIVSGSTGSGKTSLLNILSNFIPQDERIITIEDVRELKLSQNNVISLETRESNYDGIGSVTIRDLVKNSLRMRPDRIIIGEVRGSEAFDLLQAMNTGHDGSLTTLHANGTMDALNRLETMVLMDGIEVPINAMREYINNALDLVVQITRMRDGRRKITDISEIVAVKNGELVLKNIFKFNSEGVSDNGTVQGEFVLQEYVPEVLNKIRNAGINDLDEMFNFKNKKRTK